ncbi:phage virion morphogenesis protein [Testudinibacter aquarius]|uniref:Phage virion morphogenesis protein n=1 Tax=Testudinibacter aquarius TaxID=1524974 RepID=A0A4R3YA84_9PAST|nr:phage virion morphogenesis protein [Testudinibacter aquarius]KAE9526070.1 phage tail protein [Testudinibacter aquarius]TCV87263.1 phage virion morphogenesis protein [Testudinibacter aquarius]TNG87525.1 phage virion morphogenesis protein [Testudinibacter aquarius]
MDALQLEQRFGALLSRFSVAERRKLLRNVAQKVSTSQRQRIGAQKNPDGSAYIPRKPQKRKGKIKRKAMFVKLKSSRFMKRKNSGEQAEIGFSGSAGHLASVHQYGLEGRVQKNKPHKVRYDQRELLGFSDSDKLLIEDLIIDQLAL